MCVFSWTAPPPTFQSSLIVLLSSQGPSIHLLAPTYSSRHEYILYYIRMLRAFYYIYLSFFVCLVLIPSHLCLQDVISGSQILQSYDAACRCINAVSSSHLQRHNVRMHLNN